MENMSGSHCPYCKLSATNFGDEDNHTCELRTHAGQISDGKSYSLYLKEMLRTNAKTFDAGFGGG